MAVKPPSYCRHKASGQAYVYVNRKPVYLGAYDSPESRRRYRDVITEWSKGVALDGIEFTVSQLVDVYFANHVASHYRKNGEPTSEVSAIQSATRVLVNLFGNLPAVDFRPKRLKAVRDEMVASGWVRSSINKHVGRIRRMFAWAVSEELLPTTVLVGLQTVQPLKKGRCDAVEGKDILPVPEDHIEAVRQLVSEPVAAAIDLQLLTGARPTEILTIRVCDISMSGEVWQYRPVEHKTEHHGKKRIIYLGPKAQLIIRRFITPRIDAYLLTPRSVKFANKRVRERYDVQSYRKAINRACTQAEIPRWSPNRLRHNAATRIRAEFGIEAAQVILGHSKVDATQVYAERDERKAAEIMKKNG